MMEEIQRYVYKYLIRKQIKSLPLDFDTICQLIKDEGYMIRFYNDPGSDFLMQELNVDDYKDAHKAFTTTRTNKGIFTVFFSNELGLIEKTIDAAHELMHIICKHGSNRILGKSKDPEVEHTQEREADIGASILLAPPCVLHAMHITTTSEIQKVTMVDQETADTVLAMIKDHPDNYDPIEKEVLRLYGITFEVPVAEAALASQEKRQDRPAKKEPSWWILVVSIMLIVIGVTALILVFTHVI